MSIGRRAAFGAANSAKHGAPHTLTASRAAQIHRWQLLGAAARKGQKRANRGVAHASAARSRRNVAGSYAAAAKWGVTKLLLPTSLVTPLVPGRQPGDNTRATKKRKR